MIIVLLALTSFMSTNHANAFCCCIQNTCNSDVNQVLDSKKNKCRSLQNGWGIIENRINPQVDTMVV